MTSEGLAGERQLHSEVVTGTVEYLCGYHKGGRHTTNQWLGEQDDEVDTLSNRKAIGTSTDRQRSHPHETVTGDITQLHSKAQFRLSSSQSDVSPLLPWQTD